MKKMVCVCACKNKVYYENASYIIINYHNYISTYKYFVRNILKKKNYHTKVLRKFDLFLNLGGISTHHQCVSITASVIVILLEESKNYMRVQIKTKLNFNASQFKLNFINMYISPRPFII